MSVVVESTTDSKEAATAQSGLANGEQAAETNSAPAPKEQGEMASESETEDVKDGVEAEEDSSDEDGEESQEEQKPGKKKNGFKRRIDKLNSRLSERDQRIAALEAELTKRASPQEEKSQTTEAKTPSGRPDPDNFETHQDYLEALVDWKADQKVAADKAREKESAAKAEFDSSLQSHVKRVEEFRSSVEDWEEVMEDFVRFPFSATLEEVVLGSDVGPQLMYELATKPEEYARITKLSAIAQAREYGKIEARLSKASESKQVETQKPEIKKTKAPSPISPLGAKSVASTKSLDEMDYEEFKRVRNEQTRKR